MHPSLTKPRYWPVLFLCLGLVLGGAAMASAQEEPSQPRDVPAEDAAREDQAAPEMREMARSMKSMADMCQTMMQQEMAHRPYWLTAALSLGTLLTIALVLFIVLEIQWIRFWSVRIKTERKKLV